MFHELLPTDPLYFDLLDSFVQTVSLRDVSLLTAWLAIALLSGYALSPKRPTVAAGNISRVEKESDLGIYAGGTLVIAPLAYSWFFCASRPELREIFKCNPAIDAYGVSEGNYRVLERPVLYTIRKTACPRPGAKTGTSRVRG